MSEKLNVFEKLNPDYNYETWSKACFKLATQTQSTQTQVTQDKHELTQAHVSTQTQTKISKRFDPCVCVCLYFLWVLFVEQ